MTSTPLLPSLLLIFIGAVVPACLSSTDASRTSTVPTTSASVPVQCRHRNMDCWIDSDCCSGNCDYDSHYCD